ncbi:GTP 3',8-cyclase MoaA [Maribrevibacterium harenarium]|uniref:GTP 3',8-cyclase MoaA n=1 Tax=Maribrevibacterium harenarium TaxID=2589817 RepID=UPI001C61647D|nr:GTP 3',8-cyclase MoaA [Maribrevibacterium harenarium]
MANQLIDRFGRNIDYLRISVTDRCDFRCTYCMGEDIEFLSRDKVLSLEETYLLARTFVELGVKRIRVTGGEPLVRKGIIRLLEQIAKLPGLDELTITTNGSQLTRYARPLLDAGVARINISLDTLKRERFLQLTRRDQLDQVLAGIDAVAALPFQRLKLNAVVLRDRNFDEVGDLAQFAIDRGMDISYIEEMPLGVIQDHDRAKCYVSSDEIRAKLSEQFQLVPVASKTAGPSDYYQLTNSTSRIGFISPHSHNFCGDCNRVRLTCEGRLLLCLGNEHSMDLKTIIRTNPDHDALRKAIIGALDLKPEKHHFNLDQEPDIIRFMSATGG